MNIAFLTRSLSREAGGIFEVETALTKELSSLGCKINAYGARDSYSDADSSKWLPIEPKAFPFYGNDSYRYSPSLKRKFLQDEFDLCHLHSLWSHTSSAALTWEKKYRRPLLVSPNGMLDPWALKNSAWKKKINSMLVERNMLSRATCLQANTPKDIEDYRHYGLTNSIATIPNGVYLPDAVRLLGPHQRFESAKRKKAVYLGRIHPKKGLANTVHAWGRLKSEMRKNGWQLVIAGRDECGHLAELKQICRDHALDTGEHGHEDSEQDVVFMGPTYGEEKFELLMNTHLFMLPSFSEGLPMAVLEAWAHQAPVMMSPQCNLGIGFDSGAAISVATNIESICTGLSSVMERSDEDLSSMGHRGRKLVESEFAWNSIAARMHKLYQWMLGGGSPPDFVTMGR